MFVSQQVNIFVFTKVHMTTTVFVLPNVITNVFISVSRRPPNKEIYSTPPITRNSVSDKTQIVVHSTLNLP